MTKELGMYLHSVYILSLTRKVSTGTKAGQKRLPLLLMFTLSASWDSLLCLFLQASQEIASWRTEGARLQKMYLRCKLWVLFQRWMSPKVWASLNLGSLIQHFIRQRGQIQVWTHLGHVSGLSQFGFLFCPLQWSRKLLIPSATHPDQWVLFLPVAQLKKKNGPWPFVKLLLDSTCSVLSQNNLTEGVPIAICLHYWSMGCQQDPSNKTSVLYPHLDSVDFLNGLRMSAGGCQSIHGVCWDPTHRPCVQQVSDGPQATGTVGLGADAGWGFFSVLLRTLSLAVIKAISVGISQHRKYRGRSVPVCCKGVGLDNPWRSFPAQMMLWFYDLVSLNIDISLCHSLLAIKGQRQHFKVCFT